MTSRSSILRIAALAAIGLAALSSPETRAADTPATQAVKEKRSGSTTRDIVQNRFFLKSRRFELTPQFGYVPNNPFAHRYVGGIGVAYHPSEVFAAEGVFFVAPDLGTDDLKGLTQTLVSLPNKEGDRDFEQPVDKMAQGGAIAARWAPFYGKINLLGEKVLNFDFYGDAGLGLLSINKYMATMNPEYDSACVENCPPVVRLSSPEPTARVTLNLGTGFNFFLNQTLSFKLGVRGYFYVDDTVTADDTTAKRVTSNVMATAGIAIFLPKMKPRMQDF